MDLLVRFGSDYLKDHFDQYASVWAVMLSDSAYLGATWGTIKPRSPNYQKIATGVLQPIEATQPTSQGAPRKEIALQPDGAALQLRVTINGTLEVPFVLDTGAEEMVIPEDVYSVLERQGTIGPDDATAPITATMADSSEHEMQCFRIHEIKVGDRTINNVRGCVSPAGGAALLGQAFLAHLGRYTIDNKRHVLVLE